MPKKSRTWDSSNPGSRSTNPLDWLNGIDKTPPTPIELGGEKSAQAFENLFNSGSLNNISNVKDLIEFLKGYYSSGSATTERSDMLFQYFLQLLGISDQRSFDLQQLQNQRDYDNPLNQLARLTGAGIGRDQAIQILQGGNGAGVAGSGSGVSAPGVSAPSGTMQQQAFANGIAGYQAIVGSFCQMLQTGLSIETAINQNRLLAAQAAMSESSLHGYSAADKVVNVLQQMELSGSLSPEVVDSWTNADDMYKYFLDHRDQENIVQLLNSGDFQTAFGSQSGREFINDFWKQRRSSRNDGTLAEEYLKQQKFQSAIMSLQPSKISAELENIGADTQNKYQNLIESANRIAVGDAQIRVLTKQGKWMDIQGVNQTRLTDSQVNLIDTQAFGADIQNKNLSLNYEYNAAGFPILKQNRIDQLTDEMNYWATMKNPDVRRARQETWLRNVDNARDAAYVECLRLNAVGHFAEEHPTIWSLCQGFKASGASDMVQTATSVGSSLLPFGKGLKIADTIFH